MIKGDMLARLHQAEDRLAKDLLDNVEDWQSLDVDYDSPRVERLWRQLGEDRVYVHRIHPCPRGTALYHSHPWPSAVRLILGGYDMDVGYGRLHPMTDTPPPIACTLSLAAGSEYEMLDEHSWHSVTPHLPTYSIMVTGPRWTADYKGKGQSTSPLTPEMKSSLFNVFKKYYGYGELK